MGLKLVTKNSTSHLNKITLSELGPDMQAFRIRATAAIGTNLRSWLDETGITSENAWERLQVSAIELRNWEKGIVSPKCSRFFQTTAKMGEEIYFQSGLLVNELINEGQSIRLMARAERWDKGRHPIGAALGPCLWRRQAA